MNVAVYTRYRPKVGFFETVVVHATEYGRTLCGRDVSSFRHFEASPRGVDCQRCSCILAKRQFSRFGN
jgi:hypothetical protein